MTSSSHHSELGEGKDKARAPDLPPQTPQISEFPTQESLTETKSPPFTTSPRGDGRESFSKDREADECEDEDDGEVDDSSEDKDEDEDEDYEVYNNEAENYSVEKFMVDGKHFSHRHPLSLTMSCDEDDDNDDDMCNICGLPILSTPSYTCTVGCKIFLHKPCALKFPPKFIHPTHGPNFDGRHTLYIIKRASSPNFTYICEDCDFEIHPLVAVVPHVEIKIKHKSHPSHPLVAICKVISCECDACGKKQDGFFFSCGDCNFWIHQNCTILPNSITLLNHPQPFILAYSLPPYQIEGGCVVCRKGLLVRHNGVYFCPQSTRFAHVTCGTDECAVSRIRMELIQLPDDEWDAFPSSVIRTYAQSNPLGRHAHYSDSDDDDDDELTIEKYHNHPLILTQLITSRKACHLACDLCTKPIDSISSLYKCDDCHFVAHKICADILPILKFFIPGTPREPAKLYPDLRSYYFNSIFHCRCCHRPCNGLCYYIPDLESEEGGSFCIDLECMAAPSTVNHASHAKHLLFRTHRLSAETPLTCCTDDSLLYDVYRCIICDYFIHTRCAMLPKRINFDEYHHHPLYLVFTTRDDDETNCFCEVCEEDIDIKYWLYRCGECEQSFHINCIWRNS